MFYNSIINAENPNVDYKKVTVFSIFVTVLLPFWLLFVQFFICFCHNTELIMNKNLAK